MTVYDMVGRDVVGGSHSQHGSGDVVMVLWLWC